MEGGMRLDGHPDGLETTGTWHMRLCGVTELEETLGSGSSGMNLQDVPKMK